MAGRRNSDAVANAQLRRLNEVVVGMPVVAVSEIDCRWMDEADAVLRYWRGSGSSDVHCHSPWADSATWCGSYYLQTPSNPDDQTKIMMIQSGVRQDS